MKLTDETRQEIVAAIEAASLESPAQVADLCIDAAEQGRDWRTVLAGCIANDSTLVCGLQIQHDGSGVGHNWRNIDRRNIPANIVEEIEGEIIDGDNDDCDDFIASNGLHYRW